MAAQHYPPGNSLVLVECNIMKYHHNRNQKYEDQMPMFEYEAKNEDGKSMSYFYLTQFY